MFIYEDSCLYESVLIFNIFARLSRNILNRNYLDKTIHYANTADPYRLVVFARNLFLFSKLKIHLKGKISVLLAGLCKHWSYPLQMGKSPFPKLVL